MEGMVMSFDAISYIMGYEKGETVGAENIVIDSDLTYADDGNGNITITED